LPATMDERTVKHDRDRQEMLQAVEQRDAEKLVNLVFNELDIEKGKVEELFFSLRNINRIRITDQVETACLTVYNREFVIELGVDFLKTHILSLEDLYHLLLHELSHLILMHYLGDHTTILYWEEVEDFSDEQYEQLAQYCNFILDIYVYAFLHRFQFKTTGLQQRLFSSGFLHTFFLGPDMFSGPGEEDESEEKVYQELERRARVEQLNISGNNLRALAVYYHKIWNNEIPFAEAARYLIFLMKYLPVKPAFAIILAPGFRPDDMLLSPELRGMLRQISMPGYSIILEPQPIDGRPNRKLAQEIAEAIMKHLPQSELLQFLVFDQMLQSPVMLHLKRKQLFMLSQNADPLFFPYPHSMHPEDKRLRVYMDVSFSTKDLWKSFLLGLSLVFQRVTLEIFQFSNEVRSLDVGTNWADTTGGTDFNCVLRHVLEVKPPSRHAMILTDGMAYLSSALREKALNNALRFDIFVVAVDVPGHLRGNFDGILARPGIIHFKQSGPEKVLDDIPF